MCLRFIQITLTIFQKCEDLILEIEFPDKHLYWYQMNGTRGPGPMTVGTDYGNCCFFAPQINFGENKNKVFILSKKVSLFSIRRRLNYEMAQARKPRANRGVLGYFSLFFGYTPWFPVAEFSSSQNSLKSCK